MAGNVVYQVVGKKEQVLHRCKNVEPDDDIDEIRKLGVSFNLPEED